MIGLDTSAIIDIFKGEQGIKKFLETNKEPYMTTIMNYLELFFGINPGNKNHTIEAEYYHDLFKNVHALELSKDACEEASRIHWNTKKSGNMIGQFDCIIAGIFLSNGVNKILTRNKKHFKRVKGLTVITY